MSKRAGDNTIPVAGITMMKISLFWGVPALPVKNLNGSGPVHPALAGMTGILMCAAGLPVCLTRAPKPILHPPPVNKSEIKPVPGISGICRKTKKKHLKKGKSPEDVVRRYMQKVKNPPDEVSIFYQAITQPDYYRKPRR